MVNHKGKHEIEGEGVHVQQTINFTEIGVWEGAFGDPAEHSVYTACDCTCCEDEIRDFAGW
jgi:hypothetical protein